MDDVVLQALLARQSFGQRKRMIYGTVNEPGITIGCCFNNTWTYSNSEWHASSGQLISATADSTGYFEIIIPDDYVIENFTFDSVYGAHRNNVDYITSINLSYIGDTMDVSSLLFAFSNLSSVTSISGFNQFMHSNIVTMEGCFRSCKSLTYVDLSEMNTSSMRAVPSATDGRQRYGFPVCFYGCTHLSTVVLPSIPPYCYMGSGTFVGCSVLSDVQVPRGIGNNIIMESSPITLQSITSILSKLASNPSSGAHCLFSDGSWYLACQDSTCRSYISNARNNGWQFQDIVLYYDECTQYTKFKTSPGEHYFMGIESSSDSHPNSVTLGKVYSIVSETSSTSPHDYGFYEIEGSAPYFDIRNATKLEILAKSFNYTESESSGNGLVRSCVNTISGTSQSITTKNNNFKLFIQFEDVSGHISTQTSDDSDTALRPQRYDEVQDGFVKLTYTLNFDSSFQQQFVKGFRFAYIKSTDGSSDRKKGCWFGSISIK